MRYMDIKPAPNNSLDHYNLWKENIASINILAFGKKIEVK